MANKLLIVISFGLFILTNIGCGGGPKHISYVIPQPYSDSYNVAYLQKEGLRFEIKTLSTVYAKMSNIDISIRLTNIDIHPRIFEFQCESIFLVDIVKDEQTIKRLNSLNCITPLGKTTLMPAQTIEKTYSWQLDSDIDYSVYKIKASLSAVEALQFSPLTIQIANISETQFDAHSSVGEIIKGTYLSWTDKYSYSSGESVNIGMSIINQNDNDIFMTCSFYGLCEYIVTVFHDGAYKWCNYEHTYISPAIISYGMMPGSHDSFCKAIYNNGTYEYASYCQAMGLGNVVRYEWNPWSIDDSVALGVYTIYFGSPMCSHSELNYQGNPSLNILLSEE
ncbi:MAG TPA: hypothetical protein PKH33_18515 [bacterium]|nr:hypothetical protein [bacterium]